MEISRKRISAFAMSAVVVSLLLTGCATKSYVRKQVGLVDGKLSQVAATVQENTERIDATDARARQGLADASSARSAAASAQASADQANSAAAAAQASADSANQNANTKAASLDSRIANLEDTRDRYNAGPVTTVMFKAGRSDLSKEAQQSLDELVAPIAGLDRDYRVEIQGYASSEGADSRNINLSQERSEAVQRYLASKGADVIRMQVIGLGTTNPIGDNKTTSGRQMNRRAEIRVFSAAR